MVGGGPSAGGARAEAAGSTVSEADLKKERTQTSQSNNETSSEDFIR